MSIPEARIGMGFVSLRAALEQEIGARCLLVAQRLGSGANRVGGLVYSCGVDQLDGETVAVTGLGDVVAGRAGLRRDDRSIPAQQSVEEPALARVGRSDAAPREGSQECRSRSESWRAMP